MDNNDKNGIVLTANRIFRLINYFKLEIFTGLILGSLISTGYVFIYNYGYALSNPEELKNIITSFGGIGIFVLILFQIFQVVIFFIPGEFIQVAGGYIYGVFWGSVTSLIGVIVGSIIVFWLGRMLGRPFLEKIMSGKSLGFFKEALTIKSNDKRRRVRVMLIIFLIYFIPGFPKDAIAYVVGITGMRLKDFLFASISARLPAIVISASFGAGMYNGNKLLLLFIAAVMIFLFIVGVLKGKSLLKDMGEHN